MYLLMALSCLSLLLFISIVPFEFQLLSDDFKLFELSMKGFSIHVKVLVFSYKNFAISLLSRVGEILESLLCEVVRSED